jgi:carboxymethylenebutenolidase
MTAPTHDQVHVRTDDGEMPAHLWVPPSGKGPGLVLLQEIFGVSDYIAQRGADLAAAGYVVLAPELYWRLGGEQLQEPEEDAVGAAMSRAQRLDWQTTVGDAVATLVALRGRPEVRGGIGVIGFCLGGGLAFHLAALEDPDVLVSYYGSSIPGSLDLAPQVTAPSLHHFGLADDYIDADTVEQVRSAVTANGGDVVFETYPGANHAFDNWDLFLYDAEASALAWRRTLDFLAQRLPGAVAS